MLKIKFVGEKTRDLKYINVDTDNRKRVARRISGNVFKFKFKNQIKYFWVDSDSVIVPFNNLKINKMPFTKVESKIVNLLQNYKQYETIDDKIPSAPNSSRFFAVKSGRLQFLFKDYVYNEWNSAKLFYLVTNIGTNIKSLPQEFYDELYSILFAALLHQNHGDEIWRIGRVFGTAYTTIGLY